MPLATLKVTGPLIPQVVNAKTAESKVLKLVLETAAPPLMVKVPDNGVQNILVVVSLECFPSTLVELMVSVYAFNTDRPLLKVILWSVLPGPLVALKLTTKVSQGFKDKPDNFLRTGVPLLRV